MRPSSQQTKHYFFLLAGLCLFVPFLIFVFCIVAFSKNQDHLGAIPLNEDHTWYRDFSGRVLAEIQDQDIFYHNIGHSIEAVKSADIVFTGPSYVSYALDPETLKSFDTKHQLKSYNLSFIGIRPGAFTRSLIQRWHIQPKLWVLNADHYIFHFFENEWKLTLGPSTTSIPSMHYSKLQAWLNVIGRNLKWRMEDAWYNSNTAPTPSGIYRNVENGHFYHTNPGYYAKNNTFITLVPGSENCHISEKNIDYARKFLKDLNGKVVLMLTPHKEYCPQQAHELAKALNLELIVTPDTNYTSGDGGAHLDQKGAQKYTQFLLSELEKTAAFNSIQNAIFEYDHDKK